ncbi:MAG: penicillin-binding transpeptidase domain-containing protein [Oscillospiraceae bacterium]|nr:penicillin-binding transpeptidase domain-containing protein [Oscillospiraceae bacterium]
MQKLYKPVRIGFIIAIMAIMTTIFVSALYRLQIYDDRPEEFELHEDAIITRVVTLAAARGNIYDRNGVLLASGRPAYNIMINRDTLMRYPTTYRNEVAWELVSSCMDEGIKYNDAFPITMGAPFTYVTNMTSDQRMRLSRYLDFMKLDENISASDLLAWMRGHYMIDFMTSNAEARLIIGVRYELEIRAIVTNLAPYVFANDVGSDFVAVLEERGLPGVFIENSYVREYHTSNAAHVLGYLRPIPSGQLEKYIEMGYPLDALVGIEGAELAFEEILRGINGSQSIKTNENGTVLETVTYEEPIPGQHVYLTIDIGFQVAVENSLRSHIESINLGRDETVEKIPGGSVVVLDVQTGEVLAAASFPTFNRATLTQDAMALFTDQNQPMWNRAMQGQYNPGSTFKMITALAGLRHGVFSSKYFPVNDIGVYSVLYDDTGSYRPSCWIHQQVGYGHGELDLVQALERSCNYYFCYIGDRVLGGEARGADAIAQVAREFGLGQSTGVEIPEVSGIMATPEYTSTVLGRDWYRADTVMTSFGQGNNQFTPIQLANYSATIANGGFLHSLTVLRKVVSSDMSELLFIHEPVVLNEFEEKEYLEWIQEGMRAVARSRNGTAYSVFGDYPVNVAAKTGTVQIEDQDINNGVFICYAPAENPEIAISVVIEKGGSGAQVMAIARTVLDYYFGTQITAFTVPYGELIP